jgi:hypothetical protein
VFDFILILYLLSTCVLKKLYVSGTAFLNITLIYMRSNHVFTVTIKVTFLRLTIFECLHSV